MTLKKKAMVTNMTHLSIYNKDPYKKTFKMKEHYFEYFYVRVMLLARFHN